MKINTLCIIGTRPEAIKMAPIIKRLQLDPRFSNKVCLTGQHRDMVRSILDIFCIKPDCDLEVMTENQDLSYLTAKILVELPKIFAHKRPDCVLVQGDTTTTVTAALAAYYHHIPVIHIEAGLRTGDKYFPWPEEANRKMSAVLATIHCAPTQQSRQNLLQEGILSNAIYVTGNPVVDSLLDTVQHINAQLPIRRSLQEKFSYLNPLRKIILVTGHRRENFGDGFEQICAALSQIAIRFPKIDIIYPVHLNPNVQKPVKLLLGNIKNIFLIEPVDYLSFVYLMQLSYFILTDSGGIQEEAPSLGKPVLVMRNNTERPEAIDAGSMLLVGNDTDNIISNVTKLLQDKAQYIKMSETINPFGDGKSAARIVEIVAQQFSPRSKTASIEKHTDSRKRELS